MTMISLRYAHSLRAGVFRGPRLSVRTEGPPPGGSLGTQLMAHCGGAEPRGLTGWPDQDRRWVPLLTHTDTREAAHRHGTGQRKLTGTIWPGSHGDMQGHRLPGLTAGQLGKGGGRSVGTGGLAGRRQEVGMCTHRWRPRNSECDPRFPLWPSGGPPFPRRCSLNSQIGKDGQPPRHVLC